EGSLLQYIDHTCTKFGKRLLKKWISAPLLDANLINERLDAIENLNLISEMVNKLRSELKTFPDFEQLCSKIYILGTQKNHSIVSFEEISTTRLREFKLLLNNLSRAQEILIEIQDFNITSKLLKRLITFDDPVFLETNQTENMPNIIKIIE